MTEEAQTTESVRPAFEAFKERALRDPAVRAAYLRARRRDLTYGLDKRQARRVARRLNLKETNRG